MALITLQHELLRCKQSNHLNNIWTEHKEKYILSVRLYTLAKNEKMIHGSKLCSTCMYKHQLLVTEYTQRERRRGPPVAVDRCYNG